MANVLFLSPHLDDAVFSCALQILRERQAGANVTVATVFSHAVRGTPAWETYVQRRAEDENAVRLLGAKPAWLGLLDAPCRNPFYNSFRRIVLETAPGDERTVMDVRRVLRQEVARLQPQRIYVPLGVGTHIDHRHVFEAMKEIRTDALHLHYEDRPYAYIRGYTMIRLEELSATQAGRTGTQQPSREPAARTGATSFLASFRAAPYVRRYLPPGRERAAVEAQLLQTPRSSLPRRRDKRSRLITGREEERSLVLQALLAYQSQIADFLGDRASFRRRERRHAAQLGAASWRAERYWELS